MIGIGEQSQFIVLMNVARNCCSRDFRLNIRDSVIQTQYFNGDTFRECEFRLPSTCLRPITYSALNVRNRYLKLCRSDAIAYDGFRGS